MLETIPIQAIQRGMYVSALDRPWIETPFLLQGFLVNDDEQILQLRQHALFATIDRARSIGEHFRIEVKDDNADPGVMLLMTEENDEPLPDFVNLLTLLNTRLPQRRKSRKPEVHGKLRQSRLAEELIYSADIVDDVKTKLAAIGSMIDRAEKNIGLTEAVVLVAEMAESVERNPDAMLWLARLRSTDEYSYDHAVDVSVHLMVLARFMGMNPHRIELLGLIGLMQDIGKTKLPDGLLAKTGTLTPKERSLIRSHVASSMEILMHQENFSTEALAVVGSHHERYDGSGYPRRIKGQHISLFAELAGMIDTYCAMMRRRPYRDPVSSHQALSHLNSLREVHFRSAVIDQLIQCMGIYPVGSLVELNSGEVAVVIGQNQVRRLQPRVMVILGPDKTVERRAPTLNLLFSPRTPTGETYQIARSLPMNAYGIHPADYFLD